MVNAKIFSILDKNALRASTDSTSIRAPTVDVRYVPTAKYLAHIPHQIGKSAPHQILQML